MVVALDAAAGPSRGCIVFEAKDRRLSKPKFHEELDEALAQRDADYAVLVVPSEEEVPAKLHSLREYQGDKLVAVFDPEDGSPLEWSSPTGSPEPGSPPPPRAETTSTRPPCAHVVARAMRRWTTFAA